MSRTKRDTERRGERGSVLATATLGMLALLLAVGLGVDISRMYLTKTELQNAADAAALAGASGLNGASSGITTATDRAVQAMNSYEFSKTGVVVPRGNVFFAINLEGPYMGEGAAAAFSPNIRFVRVTTPDLPSGVKRGSTVRSTALPRASMATTEFSARTSPTRTMITCAVGRASSTISVASLKSFVSACARTLPSR